MISGLRLLCLPGLDARQGASACLTVIDKGPLNHLLESDLGNRELVLESPRRLQNERWVFTGREPHNPVKTMKIASIAVAATAALGGLLIAAMPSMAYDYYSTNTIGGTTYINGNNSNGSYSGSVTTIGGSSF